MCGICGTLEFSGEPIAEAALHEMVATLHHRGPDDRGVHLDGAFGMGIARLAVIDLHTGHQPVHNEDRSIYAVLNGEVYNYRSLRKELEARGHIFHTRGDAETVVHLYEEHGEHFAEHLRGMFAVSLWDARRRRLVLARDRLGVKPLFVYRDAKRVVFGSELKSLLTRGIERTIDPQAVDDFLTYGYVPGPRAIFRNLEKLPPAHTLVVEESGATSLRCYWDALDPRFDQEHAMARDPEGCGEAFWELFKEATRCRLESDVPLGVLLSGGLDSNAVLAAMREVSSDKIQTFTVGFTDKSYDESPLARVSARHFETDHHETIVEPRGTEIIDRYVEHFDEPFGDATAIPIFYLAETVRRHITVALGGDGGDELFGGYNTYAAHQMMLRYRVLPAVLSKTIIPWIVDRLPVSHARVSLDYKAKRFIAAAGMDESGAHVKWMEILSQPLKQSLRGPAFRDAGVLLPADRIYRERIERVGHLDAINRLMYSDAQVFLCDDILVKTDRMTMAHALEARSPFLDHKVVEFATRLPADQRIRGANRKFLLKKILADKIPPLLLRQKKMGFILPLPQWLCGELRPLMLDTLSAKALREAGWFESSVVEGLITEHLDKRRDHSRALWGLMTFCLWFNRYA